MPEYLAPGVYVEEVSFRPKTIEGVSTSTAGFVGPARFGPTNGEPELLTSFADYERIYGGLDRLSFTDEFGEMDNFVAHGVRAFFEEGGRRLYVSRVYDTGNGTDGRAEFDIGQDSPPDAITVRARHPGAAGNVPVTFTFRLGQNVLGQEAVDPADPAGNQVVALRGASHHDVVWVRDLSSPIGSPPGSGRIYRLERYFDEPSGRYSFRLHDSSAAQLALSALTPGVDDVRILTTSVTVGAVGKFGQAITFESLTFHPEHRQSLTNVLAVEPSSRATILYVPIEIDTDMTDGAAIAELLLAQPSLADRDRAVAEYLNDTTVGDTARSFQILLARGSDGARPDANAFLGDDGAADGLKSGLRALEDLEDISIVAAPGSTASYGNGYQTDAAAILRYLISHAERMRYRIAVLDSADDQILSEIREYRGQLNSKYAALYYPWITILDPITEAELNVPPSGHVAGIYARNDVERGVHKAPANEVVRTALGFEILLNKAQQDLLNPEGINCFRFFEGRGYQLWGARTISADPEWKYVNLRRYFAYLERSIELGTQWAVFENNGERLWDNVRRTVQDFLYNEWTSGRLMGVKPEEAYFVRCDRSTMTQNDFDNGRLICLIGVAPLRPAEFVIFRIGQKLLETRG